MSGTADVKRVAIIGGCGFIGSRLALSLAESGYSTVTLDIAPTPDDLSKRCRVVYSDIRSKQALRGLLDEFDAVFLFAAVLQKGFDADVRNGGGTNVEGVLNVLAELKNARRRPSVIFASTGGVYECVAGSCPTPEDYPKKPENAYSASKLAGEIFISNVAQTYGFSAFVLRFFTVYGPGPSSGRRGHFIASCLERIGAGLPLIIHGNGQQTRDFTHVSDVVRACHKVLAAPATPGKLAAYNIGSGQETSVCQIAEWMSEEIPGVCMQFDPAIVPRPFRYIGDINRARQKLGYEPQIMAENGMRELFRTFASSRLSLQ